MRDKILTALIGLGCSALFIVGSYYEHNYKRKDCEIVEINYETVTVEDTCGFLWEFQGTGYSIGDRVDLQMNDNNTSSIKDDIIISVSKSK